MVDPQSLSCFLRALAPLLLLAPTSFAALQSRPERPTPYAIRSVRLSGAADAPAKTILLQDGRIEAIVDAATETPPGRRILEAEGLVATPAFVDAWTASGCALPEPTNDHDRPPAQDASVQIDMREANRKGIQPAFRAVDVVDLSGETGGRHRAQGYGLLLSAPSGELLAGKSALLVTRDAPTRDLVVTSELYHHAAFRARGSGYPSTLMGYFAQLRQFFLDVRRHALLLERHQAGRPGARPPFDPDLEAGKAILDGKSRLVCEADRAADIERWLKIADEFDLEIAISGGREAWKLAEELAQRSVPVFLTLDWGEEVPDPAAEKKKEEEKPPEGEAPKTEDPAPEAEDPAAKEKEAEKAKKEEEDKKEEEEKKAWDYVEPEAVRTLRRREWEETRDCAKRLHEAGVEFAFCTGGLSPSDLLKNARALVEAGLAEDVALAALTARPAQLLGVERQFGFLVPGHSASLALWTAPPTTKDAQLAWLFVEGHAHQFEIEEKKKGDAEKPAEGLDLTGRWSITTPDPEESEAAIATLTMADDGALTGTVLLTIPQTGEKIESPLTGRLEGITVSLETKLTYEGLDITVTFDGTYEEGVIRGERKLRSSVFTADTTFAANRVPDESGGGEEEQR